LKSSLNLSENRPSLTSSWIQPRSCAAVVRNWFPAAHGDMMKKATLRRDLAGYADYQSRVRPCILPGVF
jgi:hypothetical protein